MNVDKAIKSWYRRLDAVTTKIDTEFGRMSHEQLNWKLSSEKWSIADILEHLNLVNASYEKVLTDSANGTSGLGFN